MNTRSSCWQIQPQKRQKLGMINSFFENVMSRTNRFLFRMIVAATLSLVAAYRAGWLQAPTATGPFGGGSGGQSADDCPAHFPASGPPTITREVMARRTHFLCFDEFAVLDSGLTRTPLWSAEYLTPERIRAAQRQKRVNTFHPELRLPVSDRAELSDYARSGYDRGHMAPSGDMATPGAQNESFTLANMVPQAPQNNRETWEHLEHAVREYALQRPIYVITGPSFQGTRLLFLHDHVAVPTHLYKLVYDPNLKAAAAYWVANTNDAQPDIITVAELEQRTGLDFHLGDVNALGLSKR